MAEKRSPSGTRQQDVKNSRNGFVESFSRSNFDWRGTRHAREPERDPEKTQSAKREKIRAPAVALHERATKKQPEGRAGAHAGVDEGIDEPAMPQRKRAHDDPGKTGAGGGFSDAKKKPAQE